MAVPTWKTETASASARTGAPARASTRFVPTVRSIVLLPDMFDPLIKHEPRFVVEPQIVADALAGRNERMSDLAGVETGSVVDDFRKRIIRVLEGKTR